MKLQVRKSAQGPVLAKGETECGKVEVMGESMAGCTYDIPDSTGNISYGGTYKNGGTIGVQYENKGCC